MDFLILRDYLRCLGSDFGFVYDAVVEENFMPQKYFLVIPILGILAIACAFADDTSSPSKVTGKPKSTLSGLQYWDIVVGKGVTATSGKR